MVKDANFPLAGRSKTLIVLNTDSRGKPENWDGDRIETNTRLESSVKLFIIMYKHLTKCIFI